MLTVLMPASVFAGSQTHDAGKLGVKALPVAEANGICNARDGHFTSDKQTAGFLDAVGIEILHEGLILLFLEYLGQITAADAEGMRYILQSDMLTGVLADIFHRTLAVASALESGVAFRIGALTDVTLHADEDDGEITFKHLLKVIGAIVIFVQHGVEGQIEVEAVGADETVLAGEYRKIEADAAWQKSTGNPGEFTLSAAAVDGIERMIFAGKNDEKITGGDAVVFVFNAVDAFSCGDVDKLDEIVAVYHFAVPVDALDDKDALLALPTLKGKNHALTSGRIVFDQFSPNIFFRVSSFI